ncbi:MAG: TonB-dependent receptor [Saprospiraceae bacterium]|nr:TonB-dependent receptor [Saprospiraceae bacterium]
MENLSAYPLLTKIPNKIIRNQILRIVFILIPLSLIQAQRNFAVSGIVSDGSSGEVLIGANISVDQNTSGTSTNNYGFYSISVPAGDSVILVLSYLGFQSARITVNLKQNLQLNVQMNLSSNELETITVTADQNDDNVNRPQMGTIEIPTNMIKDLPAILGEQDILKVIQLLPGVQAGNEGTTGFFVRGGNADQNLVQLDEAIVYNPNHLFGLFSSFNTRAINNVTLIKGGFPAQYGGRLSSILDINMKEGNNKRWEVEGGIGMISSQITVEGPIIQDKVSLIVSARRTYFDWLIKPFLPQSIKTNYRFYDLNAKINWRLSDKDHLFISTFRGSDDALYSQDNIEYNIFFGNQTGTLRWNHIFGPRLFLSNSIILNKYDQNVAALQDNSFSRALSNIRDISGKSEFHYYPNRNHKINFGIQYYNHRFRSLGDSNAQSSKVPISEINKDSIPEKTFNELALFLNDEIKFNEIFSSSLGIRLPAFVEKDASYYQIEPRMSFKLQLSPGTSIKTSYTLMNQFLHLIPSSTAAVPTDIWIPSSRKTRPQQSQQLAIGLFKNYHNNRLETSIEVYYKKMENQVLFKEGNQLIKTLDVDEFLTYGKGWSYGTEIFLKKKTGRFTGWAAYTLSWTYQRFDQLNFGKKFPVRYDRRHDLSLVGTYDLSKKCTFSGTFVYSSGNTFTVPGGRINIAQGGSLFEGNYFVYQSRNNARLNPFHRLNLSVSYKSQTSLFRKKFSSECNLSIYNIYSRQNPYFIYFRVDPITDKPKARQVSLLPIIPSISYNFKF